MAIELDEDFVSHLDDLIQLDYDAIEDYKAAINRIQNNQYKEKLKEFKEDHHNHTRNLSGFLKNEGYDAPTGPGMKSLLTQGKVILGNLAGDTAILKAMRSNEVDTNNAYKKINEYDNIPVSLKDLLRKGYEDEKRHLDWIEKELKRVG